MQVQGWGSTACGPVRATNEDGFLIHPWPHGGLYVVMDGVGPYGQDSVHEAMQAIADRYEAAAWEDALLEETLKGAMRAAQEAFASSTRRVGDAPAADGAAMAMLAVAGHVARMAWIGDCRLWRLRGNTFETLSRDHTLVEEMLASGKISPAEALTSPHRNILLRVLSGQEGSPAQVESRLLDVAAGDRFLLASDGVWESQELWTLQAMLAGASQRLPDTPAQIVARAMAEDGTDNGVAVVVSVQG